MHPTPQGESWRSWLMTGSRGTAVDRRRVRGAHRGLKKILIEGMSNGTEHSKPWKDFSGAMVRQAVNEALHHGVPCVVSDRVGCAPGLTVTALRNRISSVS